MANTDSLQRSVFAVFKHLNQTGVRSPYENLHTTLDATFSPFSCLTGHPVTQYSFLQNETRTSGAKLADRAEGGKVVRCTETEVFLTAIVSKR